MRLSTAARGAAAAVTAAASVGSVLPGLLDVAPSAILFRLVLSWAVVAVAGVVLVQVWGPSAAAVAAQLLVVLAEVVGAAFTLRAAQLSSPGGTVMRGLLAGPRLLFETTNPIAGTAEQAVFLVAVTGLLTVAAITLAAGPQPVTAGVPGLLGLVGVCLLAAGSGGALAVAAGLCTAVLAVHLWLTSTGSRAVPVAGVRDARWGAVGVTCAAIALGLLGSAAFATRASAGYDAHTLDVPEQPPAPQVSPLDLVAAWRATGEERPLMTVSGYSGRLVWAAMENFDGTSWTSAQPFAPSGSRVAASPVAWPTVQRCAQISLGAAFPRPMLPVPPRVDTLSGPVVDASGGMGVVSLATDSKAITPAQVGSDYRACGRDLTSAASRAVGSRLAVASYAANPAGVDAVALPQGTGATSNSVGGAVAGLRAFVDKVSPAGPPVTRLQSIAQYLREDGDFAVTRPSTQADPGFSAEYSGTVVGLQRLLAAGLGGAHPRARAELYPEAFALLARTLGVPSRVVVGFEARTGQVGTAQALVWPEIWTDDAGWLAFDVTPQRQGGEAASFARDRTPTSASSATAPVQQPTVPPSTSTKKDSTWTWVLWAVSALVLLAALSWPIAAAVVRVRRRRTLLAGVSGREQVVGAWRSSMIDLRDAGVTVPLHRTPAEWRSLNGNGGRFGKAVADLGDLAEVALYSPIAVDERDAVQARGLATVARRAALRDMSLRARAVRLCSWPPHGRSAVPVPSDQGRRGRRERDSASTQPASMNSTTSSSASRT